MGINCNILVLLICKLLFTELKNNSKLGDFVDSIYPIELEIKDITDTGRLSSCFDLRFEIGSLRTKLHDKRDDSYLPIVNYQFI